MNRGRERAQTDGLPPEAATLLVGEPVDADLVGHAIQILTSDADGRPHCALVSAGECAVGDDQALLLALWAGSATSSNLRTRPRALLCFVTGIVFTSVAVDASFLGSVQLDRTAFCAFRLEVVDVRLDEVGYAELRSGITFQLRDGGLDAVERWRRLATELDRLYREAGP